MRGINRQGESLAREASFCLNLNATLSAMSKLTFRAALKRGAAGGLWSPGGGELLCEAKDKSRRKFPTANGWNGAAVRSRYLRRSAPKNICGPTSGHAKPHQISDLSNLSPSLIYELSSENNPFYKNNPEAVALILKKRRARSSLVKIARGKSSVRGRTRSQSRNRNRSQRPEPKSDNTVTLNGQKIDPSKLGPEARSAAQSSEG